MESQVTDTGVLHIGPIQNSLFDENEFFIVTEESVNTLKNYCPDLLIPVQIKLIALFIMLSYKYQEEDEVDIAVEINPVYDTGKKSIQISFNINKSMNCDQVLIETHRILSGKNKSEWIYSDRLQSFVCKNTANTGSSVILSLLVERSVTGSIIISNNTFDFRNKSLLRWDEHLQNLLKNALEEPSKLVDQVTIISSQEKELIQKLSTSHIDPVMSAPSCLTQLFEKTVKQFPHNVAIRCKGIDTTYEEFNRKAEALSVYLKSISISKNSHIALLLPRSEEIFIAIMGILKAGAAYVPIDPRSPADRIKYILEDCAAALIITDSSLYNQNNIDIECIYVENFPEIFKTNILDNIDQTINPNDTAYIIYTSGTTGKPKGVVLAHQTVCNLIRAESYLFNVLSTDRVYQGFSVSFDASVEEMWLAWYSGATLVAATKSEALSGPDLTDFLCKEKVTVFSTVPTQISMMQRPVESIRILVLGGEECHQKAIEPWLDDSRKVFNTYGPTEATVIATCGICKKGIKPNIGKPIPNYAIYILDKQLQPVPPGIFGELCIGGHCLAKKYLNRDELTVQKFIQPPFETGNGFPKLLYRSGDRARLNPDGTIEFGGRIDDQIKLRGQRIELGEIESTIIKNSSARQVAVTVLTNSQNIQSLVAYIVPDNPDSFEEATLKESLKNFLPSYMIPNQFFVFKELPQLQSGKIDKKKLPSIHTMALNAKKELISPRNETESIILGVWIKYFDRKDISVTDDFFELGGHSLLAATIISELRSRPGFQGLPLQYVYQYRTIEALAAACNNERYATSVQCGSPVYIEKSAFLSTIKRSLCGFIQAVALYPVFLLFSIPLIIPFVIDWYNPEIEVTGWLTVSFLAMLGLFPTVILMSIATKWIVIGRFKAGNYPLWGLYYIRFWFVSRIMDLVPTRMMRGTPFLQWYYRLLGTRIGKNVYLGTDRLRISDLISIGNNSCINADVHCMGYTVSNGILHIGEISIGENCIIGTRSVLGENTSMQDNTELGELSLLPSGYTIPYNEYWEGSPAKISTQTPISSSTDSSQYSKKKTFLYNTSFAFAFLFVLMVPSILLIPWIIVAFQLYVNFGLLYTLPATILMAALYTTSFCLTVAVLKKIILPNDSSENIPINSYDYLKKWTIDTLIQLSLTTIQPLYATIYLPHWLRLLGAKIGKRAEISTVDHISADLLSIGDGSFIADSASVGPAVVRHGIMRIGKTVVGNKSFIGNSALIPIGTRIGENCLVGVLSRPPFECSDTVIHNTDWLGSPPMLLPKRQENKAFSEQQTFNPPMYMVIFRAIIEFFKITMPPAMTSCCFIFSYWFMSEILGPVATLQSYMLLCPIVIFGNTVLITLLTVILKWVLVGKYKQIQKPLWSVFIWKNEFINSLCENLVFPLLLQMIQGTPFLPWFFNLLGCKIGKNVFMETTEITEFDLVKIDDNASLNYGCTIQTHLFEDRIMKMSGLHIGNGSTVGPMSVVLYDSAIKNGAVLDGLSLLMKGETLPSSSSWFGIPARSKANALPICNKI